jgi:hypothetical protein
MKKTEQKRTEQNKTRQRNTTQDNRTATQHKTRRRQDQARPLLNKDKKDCTTKRPLTLFSNGRKEGGKREKSLFRFDLSLAGH